MSETDVLIKVYFSDFSSAKKLGKYISSNTRPDFIDEVEDTEKTIFEAFDMLEYPSEVSLFESECAVVIHYSNIWDEESVEICEAIQLLDPNKIFVFMADDGDFKEYHLYNSEENDLVEVYVVGDDTRLDKLLYKDDFGVESFRSVINKFNLLPD